MFDDCEFVDVGFSGPRFTWSNKREGQTRISERLDRACCTRTWRHLFADAVVQHLPRTHSDHHPLLIRCNREQSSINGKKPFRIETAWFLHPQFEDLVKAGWASSTGDLLATLKEFSYMAMEWNQTSFGNLFRRKRRCLARLEGIQK